MEGNRLFFPAGDRTSFKVDACRRQRKSGNEYHCRPSPERSRPVKSSRKAIGYHRKAIGAEFLLPIQCDEYTVSNTVNMSALVIVSVLVCRNKITRQPSR
jgi:hypothetical protein